MKNKQRFYLVSNNGITEVRQARKGQKVALLTNMIFTDKSDAERKAKELNYRTGVENEHGDDDYAVPTSLIHDKQS